MCKPFGYPLRTRGLLFAIIILLSVVIPAMHQDANAQTVDLPECAERLKDIKKNYPVLETDQIYVVYIDGCLLSKIWDDTDSNIKQDISFWEPNWNILDQAGYEGFYSPGTFLALSKNLEESRERYATFIIKLKPTPEPKPEFTHLIIPNKGHDLVWTSENSKVAAPVSLWEPKCPSTHVVLGLEASKGFDKPTSSKVACVHSHYVSKMDVYRPNRDINGSFWSSNDIAAQGSFLNRKTVAKVALFGVQGGGRMTLTNRVLLPPPTFWAKKDSFDPPSLDKFRGITLPITPKKLLGQPGIMPTLKEPSVENFEASPESTTEKGYSISAFLVADPVYESNTLARLLASPEYYIHRTTTWKPVDGGISCPRELPDNCTYTYSVEKGVSEATTWNNSMGVAISAQKEVEFSAKPLGIGTGAKVTLGIELSYNHDFGGETSTSTTTGTQRTFVVSPGSFAVAFQSTSIFEVYRYNDETRNPTNLVRKYEASPERSAIHLAIYPLPKPSPPSCEDVQNRDLVKCGLPAANISALPRNVPIFSESNKHYLILTQGGTLEVRVSTMEKDQDTRGQSKDASGQSKEHYVWSLDQQHLHGSLNHAISNVSFSNGVLQVYAVGLEPWSSAAPDEQVKDQPMLLDIDTDGHLRVVTANKVVIWNSAPDQ